MKHSRVGEGAAERVAVRATQAAKDPSPLLFFGVLGRVSQTHPHSPQDPGQGNARPGGAVMKRGEKRGVTGVCSFSGCV